MDLPVDEHVGYFPFGVAMNNTSVTIHAPIFLWIYFHAQILKVREVHPRAGAGLGF